MGFSRQNRNLIEIKGPDENIGSVKKAWPQKYSDL